MPPGGLARTFPDFLAGRKEKTETSASLGLGSPCRRPSFSQVSGEATGQRHGTHIIRVGLLSAAL